jgi:dimethylglycine dehydrogenase
LAARPAIVNRISYTGDLGYEIWMQPAYERLVYAAIKEAGAKHGIVDFGMRALLSMRLEKNFPTWFRELRPIYGPFEGAMDRFVKLEKNDFIGREAAAAEHAAGPKLAASPSWSTRSMPTSWATSRSGPA